MWDYDKKLIYPVHITRPDPAMAKLIITQLGGPDGELGAATRYLTQRFAQPYAQGKAILTDIGTSVSEMFHSESRAFFGVLIATNSHFPGIKFR